MAVIVMSITIACSSDPVKPAETNTSSTNSFNVSGGGYTNASFKGFIADSASDASTQTGSAYIVFTGLTNKTGEVFSIGIILNGTDVKKYTVDVDAQTVMTLVISSASGNSSYMSLSGEIDLTKWDAPGGRAKGTFSGSFKSSSSADIITVTDGKFDIYRSI
jgi:hypothetical protein